MKVLYVIHYPVFGGPHNQALRLSAPLAAQGIQTVVVLPDDADNSIERLRSAQVEVRPIPLRRVRATWDLRQQLRFLRQMPNDIRRLRRLIRSEGADIVQIGGLINPHAGIAAALEHVPVVWQLLDTRAPRIVALIGMAWVRLIAKVVMSTGVSVAKSHPGYATIADRVVPYFPPVALERYVGRDHIREQVRREWGVPSTALVVGCVANINPQKGIVELVRAFARARTTDLDARLVLVGADNATTPKYSAAVRQQVLDEGMIEGRDVLFLGERTDVERQLAGMDIFALAAPGRSEGITTAVLEAMATGLPVVVTNVGGLQEAVVDSETGFLVPPGNIGALSTVLRRLLCDDRLRGDLGGRAQSTAEDRFSIEACVTTHVRAYRQAFAGSGRPLNGT